MRALLVLALCVPASAEPANRKQLLQVLDRLTYGPRPGDVDRLSAKGVDAFIAEQLRPENLDDSACEARLKAYKTLAMSGAELMKAYPDGKKRRLLGLLPSKEERPKVVADELTAAKITRAFCSQRQLQEVMTDFWFNHFNVSAAKGQVKWLVTPYERDVIRPRVFGKFRDLLGAVAHSPAMLIYLDNAQSTIDARYAPAGAQEEIREMEAMSKDKKRAKLGLNENYARELMELHTLGVDGGYTQKDVTELARVLTGWSVQRPNKKSPARDVEFQFKRRMHDPGAKVVLGTPFPWTGEAEGERALDLLARHPATARHLAAKLCRRFVADDPPASCVELVAARFRETDGDIRETLRALFASADFRSAERFRSKVKTPLEFAVSALRATGAELRDPGAVARAVAGMGQPLYRCEPPTGYPDKAEAWVSAGALLSRMRAAQALFTDKPEAAASADRGLVAVAGEPEAVLKSYVDAFLGGEVTERTLAALRKRLEDPEISGAALDDAKPHLRRGRLAALVLGSPEFQRR